MNFSGVANENQSIKDMFDDKIYEQPTARAPLWDV